MIGGEVKTIIVKKIEQRSDNNESISDSRKQFRVFKKISK